MTRCAFCGKDTSNQGKVRRLDKCPHCGRDMRCCKQCMFYDPHAYNECKEVMAERIRDKERANVCEYFAQKGSRKSKGKVQDAKMALEALFKR